MGQCSGKLSVEEKDAMKQSKRFDTENAAQFQKEMEKIKLLILGAGESGKSTIFKQMKILHGVISEDIIRQATSVVYNNTLTSMNILIAQASNLGLEDSVLCKESLAVLVAADENAVIDMELGQHCKALWEDPGIQQVWDRRAEYQIIESVKYYFDKLDEIMKPDYIATQQDMLYTRVRTSGIVTEQYGIDGSPFEIYDVGGQRNERKKWIHCFDDVTAVIFVVALSEYDQTLFEDSTTNRLLEAVELFGEICNNSCLTTCDVNQINDDDPYYFRYFQNSSIILFLNKKDLFAEKIKKVDIKSIEPFSDFSGGLGDEELGIKYILNLFLKTSQNPERSIYFHVTCATDTENVSFVFNSCKDVILQNNLKDSGFM